MLRNILTFLSRLQQTLLSECRKGFKCALQEDDIWKLPEGDRAESINGTYTTKWKKEVDRTKSSKNGPGSPSLLRTMANTVGHLFLLVIISNAIFPCTSIIVA